MDCESCECPVSLITLESIRLVNEYHRAKRVHESSGGVMYGPDSSKWPARYADAVDLIAGELRAAEYACAKAAHRR